MACFPTYSWVLAVIPTLFLLFFNICVCVLDTAMSVCVVNSELRTRIDAMIMFEVYFPQPRLSQCPVHQFMTIRMRSVHFFRCDMTGVPRRQERMHPATDDSTLDIMAWQSCFSLVRGQKY